MDISRSEDASEKRLENHYVRNLSQQTDAHVHSNIHLSIYSVIETYEIYE